MSSRSLTPGERALVENHYGDRIDLDEVRIYNERFLPFKIA